MTTSGTAVYNPNRNQIILRAGRQVGAWASGETPSAQEVQDWSDALNALVKEWEATGLHLWKEQEAVLFPAQNQISYTIGPNSTDHITGNDKQTSVASAVISGALTITVASAANIVAGNQIGIFLDSGFYFWTTVNGTPVGNLVTLTSPISGTAALGNPVFTYTSNLDRPLRVVAARRMDPISMIETPLIVMSRLDFRDLPNKFNSGTINSIFYDPQLVNGIFWIWQLPVNAALIVRFTWQQEIQDFNAATDTADFPKEWVNCLTWNLADQMRVEYGTPSPRSDQIQQKAAESLDRVSGWDRESESYYFGVNTEQSSR